MHAFVTLSRLKERQNKGQAVRLMRRMCFLDSLPNLRVIPVVADSCKVCATVTLARPKEKQDLGQAARLMRRFLDTFCQMCAWLIHVCMKMCATFAMPKERQLRRARTLPVVAESCTY